MKNLKIIILGILSMFVLFVMSGCSWITFFINQMEYNDYVDDENYESFDAIFEFYDPISDSPYDRKYIILVDWDEVNYEQRYGQFSCNYKEGLLQLVDDNITVLIENGFYEDVIEKETVVTFISHPCYYGHPVVGVSIGDKVYLDFETGKKNWLDYIINRPLFS